MKVPTNDGPASDPQWVAPATPPIDGGLSEIEVVGETHPSEPFLRIESFRSLSDWSVNEDGTDIRDFGWHFTLLVRGKHRARWSTTRGTTRMWPRLVRGADENCNRSVSVILWPLGHLDVWWETRWRTDQDGECDTCLDEFSNLAEPRNPTNTDIQ
jgi:hypothetical protein